MKKYSLALLSIVFCACAYSQGPVLTRADSLNNGADSLKQRLQRKLPPIYAQLTADSAHIFSPEAFDRFFDKYFTLLAYNQESFAQGNSAALNITDNQTKLNLTLSKKAHNSIFNFGTALNISDNTGTLFSGTKPTAGTQFFFTHSFLFTTQSHLRFDEDPKNRNLHRRRMFWDSVSSLYAVRYPAMLRITLKELTDVETTIGSLQARIDPLSDGQDTTLSLRQQLLDALDKRDKLVKQFEDLGISSNSSLINQKVNAILKAADDLIVQRELETDGVTSFHLSWVTTGAAYQHFDYDTYDSTLAFSQRVGDQPFDGYSVTAGYNWFWQRSTSRSKAVNAKGINSWYWNINYTGSNTNSFDNLKETTLTTTRSSVQNDTIYQFSSNQKLRDITGKTYSKLWVHKLGYQMTGMLGESQFWGVNFTASSAFARTRLPVFNTHLGLLFKFLDSSNDKSNVNFELFVAFNDMSDTQDMGKSVWQRKLIGVSATVPFQKVFFR